MLIHILNDKSMFNNKSMSSWLSVAIDVHFISMQEMQLLLKTII